MLKNRGFILSYRVQN